MNRDEMPCRETKSFYKSIVRHYCEGMLAVDPKCAGEPNVPCWIPRIDDFLSAEARLNLSQCRTWRQHDCMLRRFE